MIEFLPSQVLAANHVDGAILDDIPDRVGSEGKIGEGYRECHSAVKQANWMEKFKSVN